MRNYIKLFLLSIVGLAVISCSNDKFADSFPDPSKTPTARVERLMTGVFERGNLYTMPWYTRYFTFENQQIARYAQTLGWINAPAMYVGSDSYNDTRWKQFYEMLSQFRVLQYEYNLLSESEKKEYEIFVLAANIFLYDHLSQVVDLWGDAPFTTAGFLGVNGGNIEISEATYDSAEDLYRMILSDLDKFNERLSKISLTTTGFKVQDYICAGNISAWRKYNNSLRLRIAARAADNGSLAETCRGVVSTILSNPALYPIVENNAENILINNQPPDLQAIENAEADGIKEGFESWAGSVNRASKAMLDRLEGDPRLEILFDKNYEGIYAGIDPLMVSTEQEKLFQRTKENGGNFFSSVDSATFSRNNFFPGIIITASEISFIKAEAAQKWGVAGDVKASFAQGVKQSIEFYYYINSLSAYRTPVPAPKDSLVNAFVENLWTGETNKVKLIATQKWLHYGNILSVQAWSEVRKTGYPELNFWEDKSTTDGALPPYRLKYTISERNYNMRSYAKVQDKDKYYIKLFWAK